MGRGVCNASAGLGDKPPRRFRSLTGFLGGITDDARWLLAAADIRLGQKRADAVIKRFTGKFGSVRSGTGGDTARPTPCRYLVRIRGRDGHRRRLPIGTRCHFTRRGLQGVWWARVLIALPVIIGIHLVANVAMGAYGHVWEFASISEARRVIAATLWASAVLFLIVLALGDHELIEGPGNRAVPLSVLVLGSMISLGFLGAVRFRSRLFSFPPGSPDWTHGTVCSFWAPASAPPI